MGRRRELDLLEELWPEVAAGSRQVLFIGGDPGSGKSRLAAEAAIALHRNDVSVLVGSCSSDVGMPFDPLVEPVRTLLPALDRGELTVGTSGASDPEAARDLLRLLTEGSTRGAGPTMGAVAPVVFEVVVSVLESASRIRPLVLVLEDLQWAGESALRVLRYVVERTAGLPLLVLATHRTTVPEPSILLSRVLSDLFRLEGVRRVDLAGLDTGEIADYLVLAGADSPRELRPAAALLRDRTGGNPFMLREVWRDLQRGGGLAALSEGEVNVPESLRAVLAGRLATLTSQQQGLLLVGAVIGDEFEVDLVRAVDDGRPPAAEVFADMAAAVAAGLVEDVPGRPGRWRWPHALARQSVLDSRQSFELATAHAKVGFALEDGFHTETLPSAAPRPPLCLGGWARAAGEGRSLPRARCRHRATAARQLRRGRPLRAGGRADPGTDRAGPAVDLGGPGAQPGRSHGALARAHGGCGCVRAAGAAAGRRDRVRGSCVANRHARRSGCRPARVRPGHDGRRRGPAGDLRPRIAG